MAADEIQQVRDLIVNRLRGNGGERGAGELADDVLAALGLERVGWFVRFPSGIEAIGLTPFENDSDMGRQDPVYRLGGVA